MCIVVVNWKDSEKLVKSDYFGVKLVILVRFGKEDPKKIGYSASFTGILTKQALLVQPFLKIWRILHILQVVHSKSISLSMANPEKLEVAKYLFNNYHTQYLFDNFM